MGILRQTQSKVTEEMPDANYFVSSLPDCSPTEDEELLNLIHSHPKWYQKIELPNGISTPGRDRSETAKEIFPPDLTGKTVLDVGCAEGFFCFEAKRRNAARVVGIDLDTAKIKTATRLSGILGLDVCFLNKNLEQMPELTPFDYVICLNVLHHVTDPISVISSLMSKTKEKLIFEVADLRMGIADIGKNRKSKAMLGFWGKIFKYLPLSLQPAILAVDTRARFLISRNWMRNYFSAQYPDVERLGFLDSELKHRYIVTAKMRDIKCLSLISGPTSIGKSTLIKRFQSGDKELLKLWEIDTNDSSILTASELQKNPDTSFENLILEYDLCRIVLRRYGSFDQDPVLRLLRNSAHRTVYILVTNRRDYLKRVDRALSELRRPMKKDRKKAERLKAEFSEQGRYVRIYENWIRFCKSMNCDIRYMDMSHENGKIVDEGVGLRIIKS